MMIKQFYIEDLMENDLVYGSPFVPQTGELKIYIQSLSFVILAQKWDNIINRHNLYTAYSFLATQFNFAHRPRNGMNYSFSRFCAGAHEGINYEILNDKLSRIYHEERILPVSSPLAQLTTNVREGFQEVQRYVARKHNPSLLRYIPDTFFFFIDKTGSPLPFTLERFESCIEEGSLTYPYDIKMPRHYVRTYFFKNRVSHDLANLWLGHHHVAKEALSISSVVRYRDAAKIGLPFIERMMKEIGLVPIPYLPTGDGLL